MVGNKSNEWNSESVLRLSTDVVRIPFDCAADEYNEREKEEWKPFRNALDKSERKSFDEMWDIPQLYVTACSNSVQLVPLHPIVVSILFHHYKELKECILEVEQIEEAKKG